MHDKIEERIISSPMGPEDEFEEFERNDSWGLVYNVGQVTNIVSLWSRSSTVLVKSRRNQRFDFRCNVVV